MVMTDITHESGPTSHHFISQRLRLHYLDWGNPDAPTLILVHGGRDHAHSWDWTAQALRNDWHVIAPDLRGHGDSAWSPDGSYGIWDYVYDLAQLVHQLPDEQVSLVAHSLGGAVATRYAGIEPGKVRRLVAIEGVGRPPAEVLARLEMDTPQFWRDWIAERRALAGRMPRRYVSIEEAFERMKGENRHLTDSQARHLTVYGINRNEDGSYSWKFDNYMRTHPPVTESEEEMLALWGNIACPVLLCQSHDTFMSDPSKDGRMAAMQDARMAYFDNAGHWLHHDQFDLFIQTLREFL
jgi:pimeloyl-ACP methyl ester carboxylesterase